LNAADGRLSSLSDVGSFTVTVNREEKPTRHRRSQQENGPLGAPASSPAPSWRSRGYLPHFDRPGLVQSITFRLHDAVPEPVVQSWKDALAGAQDLRRSGDFWFRDYHDRFIRDDRHLANVVEYIELNPLRAGLVGTREEWRWSSAWWRREGAGETPALPGKA
jgi:hypothetical protein